MSEAGNSQGFTHLHLHTQYSLLDGAVHFYKTAHETGVKPIMRCEAHVAGLKGRQDGTDRTASRVRMSGANNEARRCS